MGIRGARAIGEQLDGGVVRVERRDGIFDFTADAERLPARHENLQLGAGVDEVEHERSRGEHVFEVIQHEQSRAATKVCVQRFERVLPRSGPRSGGRRNRALYETRLANRCE